MMDIPRSSQPPVRKEIKSSSPDKNGFGTAGFIVSLVSIVGLGLLSILGMGLSIVGLMKKPRGLATGGLIISVLTGVAWGGAYYGVYQLYFSILGAFKPSLAATVWIYAEEQATSIADDPPETDSGALPTLYWEDPQGMRVKLPVSWIRSGEDFLVTVDTEPPLPKDTTPVSATFRVLPDGELALGFPELRDWNKTNDSSLLRLFAPMFEGIMDALEPDVKSIVAWSKKNEGKLPDEEQASSLMLRFPRTLKMGTSDSFRVNSLTYEDKGNGRFLLKLDFNATNMEATKTNSVINAEFTSEGLLVDPLKTIDSMSMRTFGTDNQ
jgi:hypothetical protein